MTFASFAGVRVNAGSIAIPLFGLWSGDISLPGDQPVPSDGAFVVGNLSMVGHVYRQALYAGSVRCRIVAGAGGWRTNVAPRQYVLNSGVKLSLVLNDAALEVGESVSVPADRIVGPGFVRESGPASRVLRQLAGANWYCDGAGVTQIAAWPSTDIPSPFEVINQDGAKGEIEIATEDYAAWMPGRTFDAPTLGGTFTNRGVVYRFDDEGTFRLSVLT